MSRSSHSRRTNDRPDRGRSVARLTHASPTTGRGHELAADLSADRGPTRCAVGRPSCAHRSSRSSSRPGFSRRLTSCGSASQPPLPRAPPEATCTCSSKRTGARRTGRAGRAARGHEPSTRLERPTFAQSASSHRTNPAGCNSVSSRFVRTKCVHRSAHAGCPEVATALKLSCKAVTFGNRRERSSALSRRKPGFESR